MASFNQVLNTRVVAKSVSRVAATTDSMLNFFGMQPGGFAEEKKGHRQVSVDIYNDARTVALGRTPGAQAGTARRNKVGTINVTFPRMYEKLPLLSEEIHNIRRIGGPVNEFDEAGADYLSKQQRYMGQRAANFRKVLLGGMIRGVVYSHQSGDDIYWDYTSSNAMATIDYQIPANNKNQCNGIIDTRWDLSSANIPLHLANLDNAAQSGPGSRIDVAICRGAMWQNIINNDYVVSQAGVANRPFTEYRREIGTGSNGKPLTLKTGVLSCAPFITWIITDEGLELGTQASPSYTPYIGANDVWFGPDPNKDLFGMLVGSEPISEGPAKPQQVRMGLHSWIAETWDPTGYVLFSVDNCLPVPYVPASMFYATVVF